MESARKQSKENWISYSYPYNSSVHFWKERKNILEYIHLISSKIIILEYQHFNLCTYIGGIIHV